MSMLTTRSGRVAVVSISSAIAAAILAVGIVALRAGPSLDRARRAYDRGDWTSSASDAAAVLERLPGDEGATRLRARSLARLGRPIEALALDADLGGERLEAEDLFLAGQALLRADRPALGWAAMDAASRLDPSHPGVAEVLASRSRSAPTGGQADRLSAVPDGPALAELVAGLAASERGGSVDLLEGLLRRDRPAFLKVDSPAAARKLLARALLEGGRAPEALQRLGRLGDDPESNWLRGRAYLASGDLERARASTARAGAFGRDDPAAPEPSPYAGASQCAACHARIYRSQQNSRHSSTLAWGAGLERVPLPDGPVLDPENPAVTHRFRRDGGRIEVESGPADRLARAVVEYALGSGHHGVTMLARDEAGQPRSLRISYYSGGRHWGLTSGFERRPADPLAYLGMPTGAEGFRACLNCHTTRFASERDRRGPEAADRGIGCERCHGPGEQHIRAVESGFPQLAIAKPKLATPARRLKLCAQCHASDGAVPPADPQFIRFQATTLPFSRCSSGSGGRLDCVACHDPHTDVETDPLHYEARCLACHAKGPGVGRSSRSTALGIRLEAVPASPCPVEPSKDCVRCHMPKVEGVMPFTSFTNHHIRIRRPDDEAARPAGGHR